MSAALPADCSSSSSSRIRRREGDEFQPDAEPSQLQPAAHTITDATTEAISAESAAVAQPQSAGVQPLPEQFSQHKKLRRSDRLVCHMVKLADVELQLVLQWLDTRSKFMAARCGRRLLHAASAPFAWKDAPPLTISASQLAAAPADSPLLRLIPLSLRLDDSDEPSEVMRIEQLPAIRVCELHLEDFHSRERNSPFASLLQSPALQSLQLLSVPSAYLSPDAMRIMAQLPQLRSLSIRQDNAKLPPLAFPALTQLAIILSWSLRQHKMLSLSQCLQLRSLSLASPSGITFGCRELFTVMLPPQQHIERLALAGFIVRHDPDRPCTSVATAEEMVAGLSVMRHLTELRLTRIYDIDALLACLHAAPSLRVLELDLEPQSPHVISFSGSTHPTAGAVCALLDRMPGLEVRLLIAPTLDEWLTALISHFHAQLVEQWNQLRRDFSGIPRVSTVAQAPALAATPFACFHRTSR